MAGTSTSTGSHHHTTGSARSATPPRTPCSHPAYSRVCRAADTVYPLVYSDDAGEGGYIQSVFELCDIPYVGPSPLGCAISFDKLTAKRLCHGSGIATPEWRVLASGDDVDAVDVDGP